MERKQRRIHDYISHVDVRSGSDAVSHRGQAALILENPEHQGR